MPAYLSVQYSAIQKAVLRHNRLWSIAGISQGLSELNEITLPKLAGTDAIILVRGGGKFTARFPDKPRAAAARTAIKKQISTDFPMLEYQISEVEESDSFSAVKDKLMDQLRKQKQSFRGYGTTYLPHLATCPECGEFPAEYPAEKGAERLCRICRFAYDKASVDPRELAPTTLQQILSQFFNLSEDADGKSPVRDFDDLFPKKPDSESGERQRMAVWLSDINNMNQKVPIWLKQPEEFTGNELDIKRTFVKVTEVYINTVAKALSLTFSNENVDYTRRSHLPFRLVVAGGDDLCLVMPEEYALTFARNYAAAISKTIESLPDTHPLSTEWLEAKRDRKIQTAPAKPYSFGAAFVVTSTHTPFHKIHQVAEELMAVAKRESDRWGNSVNWRIMAEDDSVTDREYTFERPLFVATPDNVPSDWDRLTLNDYTELCATYRETLSSSHRFTLIRALAAWGDTPERFEIELIKSDPARDKSFSLLLTEPRLRRLGRLAPERIATLLELFGIKAAGPGNAAHQGGPA